MGSYPSSKQMEELERLYLEEEKRFSGDSQAAEAYISIGQVSARFPNPKRETRSYDSDNQYNDEP